MINNSDLFLNGVPIGHVSGVDMRITGIGFDTLAIAFEELVGKTINLRVALTYLAPELTALVNAMRKAKGLPPLHFNPLPHFGLRA